MSAARWLKSTVGAAVAACLLGACSSMAPTYQRPAAPVDTRFPLAPDASAAGVAAPPAWADYFTDARLKALLQLALVDNRDLRVAVLAIEAARATAAAREADRWPTLNAAAAASRQPTASGGIASLYTAGVQVTAWEADLFGRLRSLGDVAQAQVLASEEARRAVQISLVAQVASTHLALLADDELLRVARDTVATREQSLDLVRLRVKHGASSDADLRQAESLLETARVALVQAQRQRALDDNALVQLLGRPLPADLPPAPTLAQAIASGGLQELPVGLPADVLLRRPDVRQAEQQLVAANANIGAARAAFFPRITLTGSAGQASGALSALFQAGHAAWSFVPQLVMPLFDAGRNQANLQAATVARDVAVAQYERAVQAAFRDVADALAGRATLAEQRAAQARLVQAEGERTRLAELRWRGGVASHLEWLDAQRSLLAARQALVQVDLLLALNRVAMYRVLGGGAPQPAG